jgi:hypothetical protein
MAKLIFRLRNVPDDEAEAVKTLLDANDIDWHETSAGNWGIAMPGLWVNKPSEAEQARELIDQYQSERQNALRSAYEDGLLTGETKTFLQNIKENPLKTLLIMAFCLFILYLSVNPFLQMIGYNNQ